MTGKKNTSIEEKPEESIIDNPVRMVIKIGNTSLSVNEDFFTFPAFTGIEHMVEDDIYGESDERIVINHQLLCNENIAILAISPRQHSEKVKGDGEYVNVVFGDVKGNLFTMPLYGILKDNALDYRERKIGENAIDENGQLSRAWMVRIQKQVSKESENEYYFFSSWIRSRNKE